MKPFNKRKLIGVVIINYDQTGKPITGSFQPAEVAVDPDQVEKLLVVPAKSCEGALANAQAVFSNWFLATLQIEEADRETTRVETVLVSSLKWPDGTPQVCEIAFYLATTENEPRKLTGVR